MIGIYKITNKLNNKCYIGQSIHIERRWAEHCFPSKTSQISLAIQKYGKDNFNFEILEECTLEQLDEKEQFWIKYYNSITPNGYNVTDYINGNSTHFRFHSEKDINNIIFDILNTNLSFTDIANKYNINISNISRINKGETHIQEGLSYPLRKQDSKKEHYCKKCGKQLKSYYASYCRECYKKECQKELIISREELKNLIRKIPFTKIGVQFNVSDNAIRKWCIKYNLPKTKKEINSYSDQEWDLI